MFGAFLAWLKFVKRGIQHSNRLLSTAQQVLHFVASRLADWTAPNLEVALRDELGDDSNTVCFAIFLLVSFVFVAGIAIGRRSATWTPGEAALAPQLGDKVTEWAGTPTRTSTPPAVFRSQSSPSLSMDLERSTPCCRRLEFPVPLRSPRVAPKAEGIDKPLVGN